MLAACVQYGDLKSVDIIDNHRQAILNALDRLDIQYHNNWPLILLPQNEDILDTLIRRSKAGVNNYSYYVYNIKALIDRLQELHHLGTLYFTNVHKQIEHLTFLTSADCTKLFIGSLLVCTFVETKIKDMDTLLEDYPNMLLLNSLLNTYLLPEVPHKQLSLLDMDLFAFVDFIGVDAVKRKQVIPTSQISIYNGIGKEPYIYPTGLWELNRYFDIDVQPSLYYYLSLLNYRDTIAAIHRYTDSAIISKSAIVVHKGHYGHELRVSTKKSGTTKMRYIVLVIIHQSITCLYKGSPCMIYHLLWTTYIFLTNEANRTSSDKKNTTQHTYETIIKMGVVILRDHLNTPKQVDQVVGFANPSRLSYSTRTVNISHGQQSSNEKYKQGLSEIKCDDLPTISDISDMGEIIDYISANNPTISGGSPAVFDNTIARIFNIR